MARRPVRINWRGPQVVAAVRQSAADGLSAGAITLASIMRKGMGKHMSVVGKTRTGRNIYRASPPGTYPGVRTGNLWRSIASRNATAANLRSAAGVSLSRGQQKAMNSRASINSYALWLEFGTSRMARRPWGYRSYAENRARIRGVVLHTARRSLARLLRKRGGR